MSPGYITDDGSYVPGHYKTDINKAPSQKYNPYIENSETATGPNQIQKEEERVTDPNYLGPQEFDIQKQEEGAPYFQNNSRVRDSNWQF